MGLLVVGSIALDSVITPFGETADALGGAAVFFSMAGAVLHPVQVVGVVGSDFPESHLKKLAARGVDLAGVERQKGESFRWKARYSYDLNSRETLETRLGVFAEFQPRIPDKFRDAKFVFLGNIDPELQLNVLDQVKQPTLVACDTMNYWIQGKKDLLLELLRHIDILMVNDSEARELSGDWNIYRAAHWILGPTRSRRYSTRPAQATRSRAGSWPTWRAPGTSRFPICAAPWSTGRRWGHSRWKRSACSAWSRSPWRRSAVA